MNGRTARRHADSGSRSFWQERRPIGGARARRTCRRSRCADTVEAINKARVATRILYVTAHPDDETAGLLAYLSRGLDADVALLDDHARAGRAKCNWSGTGWAAGRDSHHGIAGGGLALRRASIFYARG